MGGKSLTTIMADLDLFPGQAVALWHHHHHHHHHLPFPLSNHQQYQHTSSPPPVDMTLISSLLSALLAFVCSWRCNDLSVSYLVRQAVSCRHVSMPAAPPPPPPSLLLLLLLLHHRSFVRSFIRAFSLSPSSQRHLKGHYHRAVEAHHRHCREDRSRGCCCCLLPIA